MYGFSAVLNINTTTQKTHLKQKTTANAGAFAVKGICRDALNAAS